MAFKGGWSGWRTIPLLVVVMMIGAVACKPGTFVAKPVVHGLGETPTGLPYEVLYQVSCADASYCLAIGHQLRPDDSLSLISLFDGSSVVPFSPENTPQEPANPEYFDHRSISAIDCPSIGICVAGGYDLDEDYEGLAPVLLVWERTGWREIPVDTYRLGQIAAVSCVGLTWCLTTGERSRSATGVFDGSTWTSVGEAPEALRVLSCGAVSDCWGTNPEGVPLYRWNGSTWSAPVTTGAVINDLSCTSPTRCIAVGRKATPAGELPVVLTWNGGTWQTTLLGDPVPGNSLDRVSCVGERCLATDVTGEADRFYERLSDGTWKELGSTEAIPRSNDVSCRPNVCLIVGATLIYDDDRGVGARSTAAQYFLSPPVE